MYFIVSDDCRPQNNQSPNLIDSGENSPGQEELFQKDVRRLGHLHCNERKYASCIVGGIKGVNSDVLSDKYEDESELIAHDTSSNRGKQILQTHWS